MSYLVLARKSRPQTFEEVVGQKPVVKTLQNSLKRNRVAHAILFSGVRGVGKTTLARLMAKSLNCAEGPTPTPCNQCNSCREIIGGSSLDLHEIDGASNRGIQEVRDLKEKIKYMPTSSPHKIVIIDEVHMLTTEAFNALLKTLEEPPAHVYFMFATTELHKIPITILSRCQRYELQRVKSDELFQHLAALAQKEGVEIEKQALSLIVREAEGSIRDGLSLLDQVLSYGEKHISTADVVDVLGLVSRDILGSIAEALLTSDKTRALKNLDKTFTFGTDINRFMTDLLDYFRSLLLLKIDGCVSLLDLPEDEISSLQKIAENHTQESIHQKLSLLMKAAGDIRHSTQPRLVLETSLLAIIETANVIPVTSLIGQIDHILSNLPADHTPPEPEQAPAAESDSKKKTILSDTTTEPENTLLSPPVPPDDSIPPWETEPPPSSQDISPATESVNNTETVAPPPSEHPEHSRNIREDWLEFIAYVKENKPWMAQNLQLASACREEENELILEYESKSDFILLSSTENRKVLTEFVLDFFQREYVIHFITPEQSDDPEKKASEGPKKKRQKLANHPMVRMTEEIFGGQVGDIRIGQRSK